MIKAWLVSLLIVILFAMAYAFDLFTFFTYKSVFYIAMALVFLMLVAARIILGNPLKEDKKDDESDN